MSCVNPTFWANLPVGSKFVIRASGDDSVYSIDVGVNVNGHKEGVWKHKDVASKTGKKRPLAAGEICTFHVFVNVFHEPDAGKPVNVFANIEQPNGDADPVNKCSSSFPHAGQFPLTFFVTD